MELLACSLASPRGPSRKEMSRETFESKETLDSIFCSELIGKALQEVGLLDTNKLISNELSPKMFDKGAIDISSSLIATVC